MFRLAILRFPAAAFFAVFLLPLSAACAAQNAAGRIGWADCVRRALLNNPDIVAAKAEAEAARQFWRAARGGHFPQIAARGSFTRSGEEDLPDSDRASLSLAADQLLFDGLKTPAQISSARFGFEAATENLRGVQADVRLKLRRAFVALLRAEELLKLSSLIAERRARNLELVQLRFESGREHRGALLTAQANSAQAAAELRQAGRALVLSRQNLAVVLGAGPDGLGDDVLAVSEWKISADVDKTPDFGALVSSHWAVRRMTLLLESARRDTVSARAGFFPQLSAGASLGRSGSDWPPQTDLWSAALTAGWTLFDGFATGARLSRARALEQKAAADLRARTLSADFALREAWRGLCDASENLAVQEQFLMAAEERAKIAQGQYSNGLITFDDWTIIEDDLVRVRKAHLTARAALLEAEAAWFQAQGGTLEDEIRS